MCKTFVNVSTMAHAKFASGILMLGVLFSTIVVTKSVIGRCSVHLYTHANNMFARLSTLYMRACSADGSSGSEGASGSVDVLNESICCNCLVEAQCRLLAHRT